MTLDIIVNNYRDGVKQLEPGTFQDVDELRASQITDTSLRNHWFYTADANGYRVRGAEVEWGLVRGRDSPILANIDAAYDQLTQTDNFRASKDVSDMAFGAKDTLVTHLSQLQYQQDKGEEQWVHVEVRTSDGFVKQGEEEYVALNQTTAAALQRTGLTAEFLNELRKAGIATSRMYVLNPYYVKGKVVADPEKRDLWRASRLNGFLGDSYFGADYRDVSGRLALRGVRKVEARSAAALEGDVSLAPIVPSEITLARCYETLLADPVAAVQAMDNKVAVGLSRLVADYLATQEQ